MDRVDVILIAIVAGIIAFGVFMADLEDKEARRKCAVAFSLTTTQRDTMAVLAANRKCLTVALEGNK